MAEAREQETGMDMIPGYERPTRLAVVDTAEQNVTYRPSVRLSVCMSNEWISQKRIKLRSFSFHHRVDSCL